MILLALSAIFTLKLYGASFLELSATKQVQGLWVNIFHIPWDEEGGSFAKWLYDIMEGGSEVVKKGCAAMCWANRPWILEGVTAMAESLNSTGLE